MPESTTYESNSTANFSKHLDLRVSKQRRTLSSIQTDTASRNSSVQGIWEEDYYQRDLAFDGDSELSPLPAAHTSPLKSYEEDENVTRRPSAVQPRSLTSLLPSILSPISRSPERRDKSRSSSPTKARGNEANTQEEGFMPTLTGDKEGVIKIEDRTRGLASWFSGSSAPVALGIPINMSSEDLPIVPRDLDALPSFATSPGKLRKMQTNSSTDCTASTSTISTPKAATSSWRTPWSKTPVKQEQLPANLADDELFTLDISSALSPTSQNNAFSPSDYKNLQQTSLALLTKFQSAYQDRTRQYIDVQSTLEVEREEADEAETRVRSLRSQLEDLASQVSSRDTIISGLVAQLAEEKRARAEEKEARERSIQLVRERASQSSKHSSTSSLGLNIEDLGIRTGGKGHSKYGNHNSIDLSSPADSETESLSTSSIFSRSRSPTLTISPTNHSTDSTPEIAQAAFARVVANPGYIKSTSTSTSSSTSTPRPQRPKPQQQKSTFARLLTLSSSSSANDADIAEEEVEGCANCRGQDSSVAWDTVGLLRAENRGLKERVGELEASVEGALDLCSGLGFGGR